MMSSVLRRASPRQPIRWPSMAVPSLGRTRRRTRRRSTRKMMRNEHTPAWRRGGFFAAALVLLAGAAWAKPFIPQDDSVVLAEVWGGTRHSGLATRQIAATRF